MAAVALNPLRAWDFAAGHALVRGAGGELLDDHGRKVIYDADGNARTTRCFGGAPAAARALASRDWSPVMVPDPGDSRAAMPRNRISDADRLARAQGCLLGQVAGDALGALVEFEGKSSIRKRYPDGVRQLADGDPLRILAGQPTDDSEMALALSRSLVRHRRYLAAEVKQSYLDWYRSGPFDVGGTTRSALLGAPDTSSQANGSLMRISPAGIFAAGRPELAARLAAEDSRLTHAHPACVGAAMCFAAAIAVAVAGGKPDEMFAAALAHAEGGDGSLRRTLLASRGGKPADYETRKGWVLIALQNAFFHVMAGSALEAAVIETVNEGGDTDTNAAIAGALLGAAQGRAAVPDQWRRMVLSCRASEALGAPEPRPQTYWADDLLDLAEGLLDAGAGQ